MEWSSSEERSSRVAWTGVATVAAVVLHFLHVDFRLVSALIFFACFFGGREALCWFFEKAANTTIENGEGCEFHDPVEISSTGASSKGFANFDPEPSRTNPLGFLSQFACCGETDVEAENSTRNSNRSHVPSSGSGSSSYSAKHLEAAGIPADKVEDIAELAKMVGANGPEPVSDPFMLLRFYGARDGDLDAAAFMYRETVAWRASFSIRKAMQVHGSGEEYHQDGSRATSDSTQWLWHRDSTTNEASFAQRHGFWGRLSRPDSDGAPIAVWRLGAFDMAGIAREGLEELMMQAFAAHMEDLLQTARALSRRKGRLIRCRLVIDAQGFSMGILKHRTVLQRIMGTGKRHFPEINATVTIVRAPLVFTRLFALAKPLLTPVMKRKICILGNDFARGLLDHGRLEVSALPVFLGGSVPDKEVCSAASVPIKCDIR